MIEIILYTRTTCEKSKRLKELLETEDIKYEEIDLARNAVAQARVVKTNGEIPTPQVEIKGRMIFDYETEERLVKEIKDLMKK